MDQVRKILFWLKEQHFWVLSVLIALVGLFCWWSGASTLRAKYDEDQRKITTEFSNLASLRSNPFLPNDDINTRQEQETKELAEEVKRLWEQLYARQSKSVLQWPSGPGELSPAFTKEVEELEFGADIPGGLREHYQNYIFKHFPKLPEKIGARPIDETTAGSLGGGGRFSRGGEGGFMSREMGGVGPDGQPLEVDDGYIVEWVPEDQANIRAELEFPNQPSALRIWVAQENLWVYHTLLNVIKNTNEAAGATRPSNAAIRVLYSLQVGQPAAKHSRTPNRIYKPPTAAAAASPETFSEFGPEQAGEAGPPGEMPGGMEFGRSGLAMGGEQMSDAQEAAYFLSNRYLDATGKPIPFGGGGMDAGMDGMAADPSAPAPQIDVSQFGTEYKRIPVRMVMEMDQRHLPRLIAECATQPLQVEVQEVRINVPDALSDTGGAGGMRGGYGGGGGGSLFPQLDGLQEFPAQPQIATVVIQGVIYIFNKPDPEALKTGEGEDPLTASL